MSVVPPNMRSPNSRALFRYHWGFLVGPKAEDQQEVPGMRYHVKNPPGAGWVYEEVPLTNVKSTANLLARILIAKIEDEARLVDIFRSTPVVQGDPDWRCRTWVAGALQRIKEDGGAVGTAQLDWDEIERVAREYVGKKTESGRYSRLEDLELPRPTWDMLRGKELLP